MRGASFVDSLAARSADEYADFLLPHIDERSRLLDVGCGDGRITLGLAAAVAEVVGVDVDEAEFVDARLYAAEHAIPNVEFRTGSVYALDFQDASYDACLCHSMLETLERPIEALTELRRTLRPGGVVGVACVEYGGLILAGPRDDLLRRFYAIRERVWQLEGAADPYRGRRLRGLLVQAGFDAVVASSKYFCYGTPDAVRSFGAGRADDCDDPWYRGSAIEHGLATAKELDAMRAAWLDWSESPDSYAAFAWCRALGWRPA